MVRITTSIPILIWALIVFLFAYNHWRDVVFREGYERGVMQTAAYVVCHDWKELPPGGWRNEAWRYVNDLGFDNKQDCRFVKSIELGVK